MRHLPAEPPAFFHRGPSPLARLAFFGVVSLALLFLDTRYRYLENIRQAVAVALTPLQRAAQVPGDAFAWAGSYFTTQRALTEENAELKRKLLEQGASAQGFASMRAESARLKSLLDLRVRYGGAGTVAELLYTGRDPFAQKVFVDRGGDAGIAAGDAVIDAQGVVGQVTRVLPYMAEVTLVTDKDHAVPVKVERSGVRSVLYGAGAGRAPELRFMSPNADIEQGDVLVTSGIDGTYPPGLAVARVATLERETGQMFARITTQPLAGVDRSEYLLVLGHAAALPPRPDEPAESDVAKKTGKGRRKGRARSRHGHERVARPKMPGARRKTKSGRLPGEALQRSDGRLRQQPEGTAPPGAPLFVALLAKTPSLGFVGRLDGCPVPRARVCGHGATGP